MTLKCEGVDCVNSVHLVYLVRTNWYDQGKRDRERAILDVEHDYFEWACFTTQPAAEKVVEALGLFKGLTRCPGRER
ncbi:HEPN domain protein [Candidatus Methylomirabilis lanthanidiphila]|uniref:HEPN domain protein n=1 Tax=Candidatus Methylomirabilis lanthanidiphila TaxID=2211376 RepID=A0A564ZI15_9BACT|nr:HEPN domain protein [Candidatus Methylomirabilis lanthanidiphila]